MARWSFLLPFLVLYWLLLANVESLERDEIGFNYVERSPLGPGNWGNLRPEWETCRTGRMQSPIALRLNARVERAPPSQRINTAYSLSPALLLSRGYDVAVELPYPTLFTNKIQINGTDFVLKNIHWHTPSEHATVIGRRAPLRAPLEMHMVHESEDGKIAVIGILYSVGNRDPLLARLEQDLARLAVSPQSSAVVFVDPDDVVNPITQFYRYMGSLTTPPCSEGIFWSVITSQGRSVSSEQLQLLMAILDDDFKLNARPLQPVFHPRTVHLYSNSELSPRVIENDDEAVSGLISAE